MALRQFFDPASQTTLIETEDGQLIPKTDVGGTLQVGSIDTGIKIPDAMNAALINAGARFDRGRMAIQDAFAPEGNADARQQYAVQQQALQSVQAEHPAASFVGGILPALATAPLGGGLVTQMAIGAADRAMDFNPDQGIAERATWGAGGAGFGYGLGAVAGRVLGAVNGIGRDVVSRMLPKRAGEWAAEAEGRPIAQAAQDLLDVGGAVSPGQRFGNKTLQGWEVGLSRNPFTRGLFDENAKINTELLNKAALKSIGIADDQATRLTPEVLSAADDQLSNVFNQVGQNTGAMDLGEEFGKKLLTLDSFRKLRGLGELQNIDKGVINPGEYMTVRQSLVDAGQRAAANGEGALMQKILGSENKRGLVDTLDGFATKYLQPEEMGAFNKAREQWRNLSVLQQSGVINAEGNVSAPILQNRISNHWGKTFKQDRIDRVLPETGELFKTLRALNNPAVRPLVGSSGTAEGMIANQSLDDVASGLVRGDIGALTRLAGRAQAGKLYERVARNNPEALIGLIEASPSKILAAGRAGAARGGANAASSQ